MKPRRRAVPRLRSRSTTSRSPRTDCLSLYISYGGGTYLPVITGQSITALGTTEPSSFRFGFTGSTGGSRNIHEILCFQATPADVSGTSVGVNEQEATKVASGTQAYLAYYYPSNWTGRLTASDLLFNPTTQTLSISAVANWDASCNLTGIAAGVGNNLSHHRCRLDRYPAQPFAYSGHSGESRPQHALTWNGGDRNPVSSGLQSPTLSKTLSIKAIPRPSPPTGSIICAAIGPTRSPQRESACFAPAKEYWETSSTPARPGWDLRPRLIHCNGWI